MRLAVVFGAAVRPDGRASPALARRTDHAARLWRRGEVDAVLASGGLGRHPPTEARVMYDRLVAAGVDPRHILRDEEATTTMATARFVARLARERPDLRRFVVVTDRCHAPRARLALWGHGVRASASCPPVTTPRPDRVRAWRREAVGLPAYAVRAVTTRLTAHRR